MDNLSHALSGLAAGELTHRCLPQEDEAGAQALRRRLLLITGLLSASFPDLDLILTPLLPEPLGYLLHHRGHTHTFLYAIPQALLLAALLLLAWPAARSLLLQSRPARLGFCLTLAAGFVLHITMDFLNSYGVHPFHPFNSRWFYGDTVFIVEPVFWVAFGVPLLMMIRRPALRWLLMASLAGVLAYFSYQGFLSWASWGVLAAVGLMLALLQKAAGESRIAGLLAGVLTAVIFVGGQAAASTQARRLAVDALQSDNSGMRVLDVALTPFPANPLCWMYASMERSDKWYLARRGIFSLAPDWMDVANCPSAFAPLSAAARIHPGPLVELAASRGDRRALQALYERDCHFRAWMRFARIPLHQDRRAKDIRFERSDDNFTAIDLDSLSQIGCTAWVPQWGVPRSDLLNSERPRPIPD